MTTLKEGLKKSIQNETCKQVNFWTTMHFQRTMSVVAISIEKQHSC
jgi:hypothetical protein